MKFLRAINRKTITEMKIYEINCKSVVSGINLKDINKDGSNVGQDRENLSIELF